MDYGHALEFGSFLTPDVAGAERVVQLAQLCEDIGLDLVTVQDHPYQARFLDTWTLLSVIGARTRKVRLAPNVANLPLRPPAVLARSVASLDILTGGRVELGLERMNAVIDGAAVDAGREPSAVRRIYNIVGTFGGTGSGFLDGPASTWVDQLVELALEFGISGFVLMSDAPDDLRRSAAEVAPAVTELVDAERCSDDRTRRSTTTLWDESTRPGGPARDPDRSSAAHEQAAGHHLVEVHDHLRGELARIRDLVTEVNAMTMRQNNWTAGVYCTQYWRVVTTHHAIDDGAGKLQDTLDLLSDTLLSHLSYEERELVEPLARLGFY